MTDNSINTPAPITLLGLYRLVADDSFACSFQSMGQYRTALLARVKAMIQDGGARAALSAQQEKPVAWSYECRQPVRDEEIWAEFFSRSKPEADEYIRNVTPLFAHPVAQQDAPSDPVHLEFGYGNIEVGQGFYGARRVPAILFGRHGAGEVGIETKGDRFMAPGECIAALTFCNRASLNVVIEKMAELRARIWPEAETDAAIASSKKGE